MINAEKSAITFSRKTPTPLKEAVKNGIKIVKEGGIGKYLGLPEHFGRRKKDMFASIVNKIKQKASGWSTKLLSPAGKMVMLKSVLFAMPSHAMTCFKLPVSLCKRIQSVVTRFWWDGNSGKNRMAWISWTNMTLPKSEGGLGFLDFQSFNDAFLAKLSWRFIHKPRSLFGRILLGKYCLEEDFL